MVHTAIALFGFIGSGATAVAVVTLNINRKFETISVQFYDEIKKCHSSFQSEIQRVYERFDERKRFVDCEFMRKDLCNGRKESCGVMFAGIASELGKLNSQIEHDRAASEKRTERIEGKLEEMRSLILSLHQKG